MTRHASPSLHDQAGLIGKVALFWIVFLLLVGLLVLDGISIVLTTFRLSNTAQAAATTAATQYKNLHDTGKACTLASADLISDGVPTPGNASWCKINTSSGEATIQLKTDASTLVLGRFSFTQDFTKVSVKESAQPAL